MKWKDYYNKCDGWSESTQYGRLASITDFGPETSPSEEITDCVQYVDTKTSRRILFTAIKAGVRFKYDEIVSMLYDGFLEVEEYPVLLAASGEPFTASQLIELSDYGTDDDTIKGYVEKACLKPLNWSGAEILELYNMFCDQELLEKMLRASVSRFTEEELDRLCDEDVSSSLIKKISVQSGIPYADADEDGDDYYSCREEASGAADESDGLLALLGVLGARGKARGSAGSGFLESRTRSHGGPDPNCNSRPPHYGYRYGRWYYGNGHDYGCEPERGK